MLTTIVRVDRGVRGAWEVVSNQGERVTCKTMDDARHAADRLAAIIGPVAGASMLPTIVRVDSGVRGAWEVVSNQGERVTCKTMEEARHAAERLAAGIRPCETVILDAYHRVVHLEVNGKPQERPESETQAR